MQEDNIIAGAAKMLADDVFNPAMRAMAQRLTKIIAEECAKIADKNRHNMLVLSSNPVQSGAARDIAVEIRARFGLGE